MIQQGHYFDVNCVSSSHDTQMLATGADDDKVNVIHIMTNSLADNSTRNKIVRAWDLLCYRNFRTFTTPSPRQFAAFASDYSGEIIWAGTLDSFDIFVWSMKMGRLLDILSGHEGPVHGLMVSPTNAILASSSWDRTVRLWDVFEGKGAVETFPHTHDVLTVVYPPDGKQLDCSTLDGQIHFWDPYRWCTDAHN